MSRDIASYAAVLFDLDGVLTPTAEVHRLAWKRTFDRALAHHLGNAARPFTIEDYLAYVDGKPRYDGVHSFLFSRGIDLPTGSPSDSPSLDTETAIGNMKNDEFTAVLESDGVEPFRGSVALLDELEAAGVAVAVVSSSANARAVLAGAGLAARFAVVVDGVVARDLGLPGKPAPDTFLEAARELAAEPSESVVIEDAISGIEAGVAGGFGLVVGVDREGQREAMVAAGAHRVVRDLAELVGPGTAPQRT
jgi:beta-phosphoglucomutase family hydrolase